MLCVTCVVVCRFYLGLEYCPAGDLATQLDLAGSSYWQGSSEVLLQLTTASVRAEQVRTQRKCVQL